MSTDRKAAAKPGNSATPRPHADRDTLPMDTKLLTYYEAIEQASADMLRAARLGNWDEVVKLEGACVLLISQLKQAAREQPLQADGMKTKSRIMQRILLNDAEIRNLAEPWLQDLERSLSSKPHRLH